MNKEKQIITIAKACGLDINKEPHLPDFCNDLNATRWAERTLLVTVQLQARYIQLLQALSWDHGRWIKADGWACFASAAQRAEALLKTINKWEE